MTSDLTRSQKQETAPRLDESPRDSATVVAQDNPSDATRVATADSTVTPEAGNEPQLAVGDIVSERYELLELIGEGGMGKVYLANDLLYAREFKDKKSRVAIKVLSQDFAKHKLSRIIMQREARKSQQLSHPNIVRVHHFDQHGPHAYMIMEYIEGMPLSDFLGEQASGGLPLDDAMPIIEGMALGLDHIHQQKLVHCDFKPGNVFVANDQTIKVLDLGIARASENLEVEAENTEFDAGSLDSLTPAYASCEIFEGMPPDPADDVYALACITYQLLTGRHPFDRTPSIRARRLQLKPAAIANLGKRRWSALERGLAFAREDRTGSAATFLDEIKDARPTGKRLLAAVGGLALLGLAGTAISITIAVQPPDPDEQFLMSLRPAVSTEIGPEEAQRLQRWIDQGTAYLEIAEQEFAQGKLATAHHILKGGADNAYWAFSQVAERLDSSEARQGLLAIVNSYASWAASLREEQPLSALWAACQGASIHPEHKALKELTTELTRELNNSPGNAHDCASLIKAGSPPDLAGKNFTQHQPGDVI
jgi:serine/threonine protein kinase